MKKVSVVVPCYNVAIYLNKCVEHLLYQTIGSDNIEIILVNDASTDDGATWKMITEYEQRFPEIIIAINLEKNLRQGGARNVGVSYASGEYLIFCDADDWLLYETLEHCYQAAKEHDADVVEFLINNIYDHEMKVPLEKGEGGDLLIELSTEEVRKKFLLHVDTKLSLGSQKKFYRTALIRDNRIAFVEQLIFEEPSFMLPVRIYENRHYFLNEKLYICCLSQESTVRSSWEITHRWDNPRVWMMLIDDLSERGMLQKYYAELEYLFLNWGLGLSIRMLLRKGCIISKEELIFLINMTLKLFPGIRDNRYVANDIKNGGSNEMGRSAVLLSLLDMEIKDETLQDILEMLIQYL